MRVFSDSVSVIESSGGWAYYDFSIGTSRLCDERDLMVDPLKLFWVITNSTYLGRSLSSLRCATEIFEKEGDLGGKLVDESRTLAIDNVINDTDLPFRAPLLRQTRAGGKGKTFSRSRCSKLSRIRIFLPNHLSVRKKKIFERLRDDSFPATSIQERILSKGDTRKMTLRALKFQLPRLPFHRWASIEDGVIFKGHIVRVVYSPRCHSIQPKIDWV